MSSVILYLTEKAYSARWAAIIDSTVTVGTQCLCWASADEGSRWIATVVGFRLGDGNEPSTSVGFGLQCSIFGDIGGLGS